MFLDQSTAPLANRHCAAALSAAPPDAAPPAVALSAAPPDKEEGSAIIEFVFLAVLLMIPVAYLILTVGQMQGGSYAVVGAADQAARVYVLAPNQGAAQESAQQAVNMAVKDMGFDPAQTTLSFSCTADCLTPGTIVTAKVTLVVELPLVSSVPGVTLQAATVESAATAKVGRFK